MYADNPKVGRHDSLESLRHAFVAGERPDWQKLVWPTRGIVVAFDRWLKANPGIIPWCAGKPENVELLLQLFSKVVDCVAKKKAAAKDRGKQASQTWFSFFRFTTRQSESAVDPFCSERAYADECLKANMGGVVSAVQQTEAFLKFVTALGFSPSGWDLSSGSLELGDIAKLLAFSERLGSDKTLQEFLSELGRLSNDVESGGQTVFAKGIEVVLERKKRFRERLVPNVEMDVTGLEYSDELERMLPDELAILGTHTLMPVWLARYSDAQLGTYRVHGTDIEQVDAMTNCKGPGLEHTRSGPVIALVDTSGSMGTARREYIAKAVVLILCRLAQRQGRRVFVISFSGPGENIRFEFTPNSTTLVSLTSFLSRGFNGGTDIVAPLNEALDKIESEIAWKNADIFIASDGEFGIPASLIDRIKKAKAEHGFRVGAVLIGRRSSPLKDICETQRLLYSSNWD